MRLWLPMLVMVGLSSACMSQAPEPAATEVERASALLTDADVRIAASVDTTAAADQEVIACLRRFFTKKLVRDAGNDFWYAPDLKRYGAPYSELYYAEYDSVGDLRY